MNYFINLTTVEQFKFTYRKLCMKFHPDRGGDTAIMQEINKQYQQALQSVDGQTTTGTDGEPHQYYYHADIESTLIEVISQLITLQMQEVEIALIGTWIWIIGNSKPYKDVLKMMDCKWHFKRQCWYYRTSKYRTSYSNSNLDKLSEKYGFKSFRTKTIPELVH